MLWNTLSFCAEFAGDTEQQLMISWSHEPHLEQHLTGSQMIHGAICGLIHPSNYVEWGNHSLNHSNCVSGHGDRDLFFHNQIV